VVKVVPEKTAPIAEEKIEPPTAPPVIETPKPETKKNPAIASLYQQKVEQPTEPKKAVVTPTAAPVDNTLFILKQIPLLLDRSSRFQRSVPSIDYAVHVYSEEDGAGFVKLNGAISKVGAQIAPDLRLIAILNDSIVLDLNGTQFRLQALNSWVNYN
jgi:hypothetical protein